MKPITEQLYSRSAPLYPVITAQSGCEGTTDNSTAHDAGYRLSVWTGKI